MIRIQSREIASMIRYLKYFGLTAAFVAVLGAAGPGKAQTSDLIGLLTSQLGVTEQQATGGVGSLLGFAKEQMGIADFDVVSSALPGVDSLIGAAPEAGSGALGSASSMLGGTSLGGASGGLGDIAGVASSFSELGMSPDMVNQFVPVILEYAQSAGSEQAMQLLQGAFTAL
jgi:hypothetical protein